MNSIDTMIEVLQAIRDGKPVEYRVRGGEWETFHHASGCHPAFGSVQFRVASAKLEAWANQWADGSLSAHSTQAEAQAYGRDAARVAVRLIECDPQPVLDQDIPPSPHAS